jgi:hypothetical protein
MYEQLQTRYGDLPISILPVKQHNPSETKQEFLMNSKNCGSFSSVVEDPCLPVYDIMSLAKWLLIL